ncbi:MAG: dihydrodipicolinate synthase family protein, partial [Gaiellales bacterium]
MIKGTLAAAVTPLSADGARIDADAVEGLVDFLRRGGVDGILAMGTTGEGILLSTEERRRLATAYVEASGDLALAVHAGAQTTADTVALAEHAASCGADAVAVIGPPYFACDEEALFAHFAAAAEACSPVPFYLYEFAARAGYGVPLTVIRRLQDGVPNLRGLKISNTPWEAFEPYLLDGLDAFAGPEVLISRALAAGAAGAVSGLAAAFPEPVVAAVRS